MEQFFVILAIAVFWLIRGGAQARQRRDEGAPDWEPFESEGTGPAALEESIQAMELRAEQRAAEALHRWEARQALRDDTRPAHIPREGEQKRVGLREALRSIAATLPVEQPEFQEARLPVTRSSGALQEATGTRVDRVEADPYALVESDRPGSGDVARAERVSAHRLNRREVSAVDTGRSSGSAMRRIERLPPLQRGIVFAAIFGPPVALRDHPSD